MDSINMTREEFIKKYSTKKYIGDGCYVSFDGFHFILSTERFTEEHWIGLDPDVFDELLKYREKVYGDAKNIITEAIADEQ